MEEEVEEEEEGAGSAPLAGHYDNYPYSHAVFMMLGRRSPDLGSPTHLGGAPSHPQSPLYLPSIWKVGTALMVLILKLKCNRSAWVGVGKYLSNVDLRF